MMKVVVGVTRIAFCGDESIRDLHSDYTFIVDLYS